MVTGQVEDNGEWLRISGNVFLPMRVGAIQILEPVVSEAADKSGGCDCDPGGDQSARWWTCGPSSQGGEQMCGGGGGKDIEVVVSMDRYLNIPEGLNQQLPWEDTGQVDSQQQTQQPLQRTQQHQRQHGLELQAQNSNAVVSAEAVAALTTTAERENKEAESQRREDCHEPGKGAANAAPGQAMLRMTALRQLPESVSRNPLSDLDAANRHFFDPINPFSDTPRGGSPSESPLRSRPVSLNL